MHCPEQLESTCTGDCMWNAVESKCKASYITNGEMREASVKALENPLCTASIEGQCFMGYNNQVDCSSDDACVWVEGEWLVHLSLCLASGNAWIFVCKGNAAAGAWFMWLCRWERVPLEISRIGVSDDGVGSQFLKHKGDNETVRLVETEKQLWLAVRMQMLHSLTTDAMFIFVFFVFAPELLCWSCSSLFFSLRTVFLFLFVLNC